MAWLKLVTHLFWSRSTITLKLILHQLLFIVRPLQKKNLFIYTKITFFFIWWTAYYCHFSWLHTLYQVHWCLGAYIFMCICFSWYNIYLLFADLCNNLILFAGRVKYKLFAMMTTFYKNVTTSPFELLNNVYLLLTNCV